MGGLKQAASGAISLTLSRFLSTFGTYPGIFRSVVASKKETVNMKKLILSFLKYTNPAILTLVFLTQSQAQVIYEFAGGDFGAENTFTVNAL